MSNDKTVEVSIPVSRPAISGLLASVAYAILCFNTYLALTVPGMGLINGLVGIGMFGLLHVASHQASRALNACYYEIAMDKAALKFLINKTKELGTFDVEDGLKEYEGEQ